MEYEIGKRISEIIKKRNITQKQLAELLQITPSAVNHYIKGNRKVTCDMLLRLCDALQITVQEFWHDDNDEYCEITDRIRKLDKEKLKRLLGYLDAL